MRKTLPIDAVLVPDNAERVLQGIIFDVYHWPQRMFDGRIKTFEILRRPDTVQAIVVRDNKILLVNDSQPGRGTRLHMPGGRADEEDGSWLSATQRELREETGLVCKSYRLIDVHQPLVKIEWFVAIFLVQDIVEELPQQLDSGGEQIELIWKDFEEVRDMILTGKEPTLSYMVPLFTRVKSLEELVAPPVFIGKEVDR